ncbi:MAG: hypothetical protein ACREKL_05130 [Chthoniobacterales bacterium]
MKLARVLLAAILCASGANAADSGPIIREAGAIYLSDFATKPMKLKVLEPAPAYFDLTGQRYAGTLKAPQVVEVKAISENAYRVRGNAQQGQILGWVSPKFLQPIPKEVLEALKKSDERRRTVEALIAKNEVAIGMTTDEVQLSLGKPQKKTSRASKDKALEQVYDYVKYELIPQTTNVLGPGGVYSVATTYVKTPIGTLTVTFKDGIVESLDQSEGSLLTGNETTIVAPPILVVW